MQTGKRQAGNDLMGFTLQALEDIQSMGCICGFTQDPVVQGNNGIRADDISLRMLLSDGLGLPPGQAKGKGGRCFSGFRNFINICGQTSEIKAEVCQKLLTPWRGRCQDEWFARLEHNQLSNALTVNTV